MPTLHLDIYFELICPWCLIGKRNLDSALSEFSALHPSVTISKRWHSVQLISDMPQNGIPFMEFYTRRLGDETAVRMRQAQVKYAAAQAGIELAFERIAVMPNTARAHRLLDVAVTSLEPEPFETLLDDLLQGYFQRGENIGDSDTLLTLGARHGLDTTTLAKAIAESSPIAPPAGPHGQQGVPFFVFDNRIALAGAQAPHVLLATMRDAVVALTETASQEA